MMQLNTHISVTVPGTCGELVQGWSAEWDEPVLVSCPVARFNRLTVQPLAEPSLVVAGGDTAPTAKLKRAAHLALNAISLAEARGILLSPHQFLPVERGMGSSTADIVAAIAGVGSALGRPFSAEEIVPLACQIEPSDSTMFTPLTALAYRSGNYFRRLGSVPPLPLLVLDTGQHINTRLFNFRLDETQLRQLTPQTTEALHLLADGIAHRDFSAIGAAASLSAESFQCVSYSNFLPRAQQWATETHALGVVRAHSGGVMGLLFLPDTDVSAISRWLRRRFDGQIIETTLISGGAIIEKHTGSG